MTAWDYCKEACKFVGTIEGKHHGPASNSEIKRWLQNKAVVINGERPNWNDEVEFPVWELVLFPKGNRRTTIFYSTDLKPEGREFFIKEQELIFGFLRGWKCLD